MTTPTEPAVAESEVPVTLDRRVRRFGSHGEVLIGGDPVTLLRLSDAGTRTVVAGQVDPKAGALSATLAAALVDRGIAHPDISGAPRASNSELAEIAVVIPVHDDADSLTELLDALADLRSRGLGVVVVDDGSSSAVTVPDGVVLLRHDAPRGPSAARNAGVRASGKSTIVFLDADVRPCAGWIDPLVAHLRSEQVVLVAPRIVAAEPGRLGVSGYETARSALDLGPDPAPIRPRTRVAYVPSAAMALRLDRLPRTVDPRAPFDESMHVAEDVDLCWRLADAGARLRYEPSARVAHRHRTVLVPMLRRRCFYGSGAADLATRHGAAVAPAVFSSRGLAAAALLWWARPWSVVLAVGIGADIARRLRAVTGNRTSALRLARATVQGAAWQFASALLRPYWPVTVLTIFGALLPARRGSRLARRLLTRVAAASVAEGLHHWWISREPGCLPANEPLGHLVVHRLDDLAYGLGVWRSAWAARSAAALRPEIRR